MPAPKDSVHSGLAVIHHLEYLFWSWDTRMEGLVSMRSSGPFTMMLSKSCQIHGLDVLEKEAPSAHMVGRRIGEWVVSSSGPKGFSRFPREAWNELPDELLWMRRLYVQQYLASQLGLEPSVEVDVQGALA
jgi:hypothetical protein